MWTLYVTKSKDARKEKYNEFQSIVEAFRVGNRLVKEKYCNRYRVEKVRDIYEA